MKRLPVKNDCFLIFVAVGKNIKSKKRIAGNHGHILRLSSFTACEGEPGY